MLEGGGRSSRRRSTTTRRPGAHLAALEGGGARLPLLPRARPAADRADRGDARARPRRAARAARGARRAPRARRSGCPPRHGQACSRSARSWATSSRRPWPRRRRRHARLANWVTERAAPRASATPSRGPKVEPGALARAGGDGRGEKQISRDGARRCSTCWSRRAATPRRSSRRAAWPCRERRARGDRGPRDRRQPRRRREDPRGKGKAIGAIVGAVMRETKGRADGGEVNRLIREKISAH